MLKHEIEAAIAEGATVVANTKIGAVEVLPLAYLGRGLVRVELQQPHEGYGDIGTVLTIHLSRVVPNALRRVTLAAAEIGLIVQERWEALESAVGPSGRFRDSDVDLWEFYRAAKVAKRDVEWQASTVRACLSEGDIAAASHNADSAVRLVALIGKQRIA